MRVNQARMIRQTRTNSFAQQNLAGSVSYRFDDNRPADLPKAALASGFVTGVTGNAQCSMSYNQSYGGDPNTLGVAPVTDAFTAYVHQANQSFAAS